MIVFEKASSATTEVPLLTLVVLFYNQKPYVQECVKHALAQTYPNCELVFTDDASTDGTGEEIVRCVRDYSGSHAVKVNINEKNLGFGEHFAFIAPHCTGTWVATQGGDDYSDVRRLEVLGDYIRRYPDVLAIGSGAHGLDMQGKPCGLLLNMIKAPILYTRYTGGPFTVSHIPKPPEELSLSQTLGATAAYRSDVLNVPPFPHGLADEDLFLSLRAILRGDVLMIPDQIVFRRVNQGSLSHYRKSEIGRSERRNRRAKLSRMRFLTWAAIRNEQNNATGTDGFGKTVEIEWARGLIQSFALPQDSLHFAEYKQALIIALREFGLFKLLDWTFCRGNLMSLLRLMGKTFLFGGWWK